MFKAFACDVYRFLSGADRFARGNVSIQGGAFITTDDLEEERRKMVDALHIVERVQVIPAHGFIRRIVN